MKRLLIQNLQLDIMQQLVLNTKKLFVKLLLMNHAIVCQIHRIKMINSDFIMLELILMKLVVNHGYKL